MKTGSYRFAVMFYDKNGEISGIHDENGFREVKPFRLTMKKYEIWIGYYHLGQGYGPSTEPHKVAEIEASSFKIACVLHEHQSAIDSLKDQMAKNRDYIEDIHFGTWSYDPKTNSNDWTGQYFESHEEALKSFK